MVAAAVALASAATLTAAVPTTPTGAWETFAGSVAKNDTGGSPGVLLVGDSLVQWSSMQGFADNLRIKTGRNSLVPAAASSSYSHWVRSGLMTMARLPTIQDYVHFTRPGMTVIALGTNDARLLHEDPRYTTADVETSVRLAVGAAKVTSRCVILVNVHTTGAFSGKVSAVNGALGRVAAGYADKTVIVANWSSRIAGKGWYGSDGVHHNATGRAQYIAFVTDAAMVASRDTKCRT